MTPAETPAVSTPTAPAAQPRAARRPRLEVRALTKSFSGVTVLDDARLSLAPGEIHALVGQNGSGKSTLIKLISGVYRADPGGEVLVDGEHLGPPIHAGRLHHQGLAFVPPLPRGAGSTTWGGGASPCPGAWCTTSRSGRTCGWGAMP